MNVPKHERLLNLILFLMERSRPVSAEEIHREIAGYPDSLRSFRRTFERDKAELREIGVPLQTELVDLDDPGSIGYRIDPENYALEDPHLTPTEVAALSVAVQAVRLDGLSADSEDAMRRLGGVDAWLEWEAPLVPTVPIDTPTTAGDVLSALADSRLVSFRYDGVDRVVEPHRLDHRRGRWYLTGHDRTRDARRVFRLDRIEGEVALGERLGAERAEPTGPVDLEPWLLGPGDTTVARVVVDAGYETIARRQFGMAEPAAGTVEPDTASASSAMSTLDIDYRSEDGLFQTLLGLLDHAELIEPAELRARFVERLRRIAGTEAPRAGGEGSDQRSARHAHSEPLEGAP